MRVGEHLSCVMFPMLQPTQKILLIARRQTSAARPPSPPPPRAPHTHTHTYIPSFPLTSPSLYRSPPALLFSAPALMACDRLGRLFCCLYLPVGCLITVHHEHAISPIALVYLLAPPSSDHTHDCPTTHAHAQRWSHADYTSPKIQTQAPHDQNSWGSRSSLGRAQNSRDVVCHQAPTSDCDRLHFGYVRARA